MTRVHGKQDPELAKYSCESCEALFVTESTLKSHYTKIHGKQFDQTLGIADDTVYSGLASKMFLNVLKMTKGYLFLHFSSFQAQKQQHKLLQ